MRTLIHTLLLAAALVVCIASSSENKNTSSGASAEATNDVAAKVFKVGDSFDVGEFSYKVTAVRKKKSLGNQFAREKASDGASFVVVEFVEKNNGKETKTGLTSPFRLGDKQGRKFETSSRGETAIMLSGGKTDLLPQLQPGIQRKSTAVFEVPDDALVEPVQLVVTERGFAGIGTAVVEVAVK